MGRGHQLLDDLPGAQPAGCALPARSVGPGPCRSGVCVGGGGGKVGELKQRRARVSICRALSLQSVPCLPEALSKGCVGGGHGKECLG
eukprot:359878-Chlamydomonas_euryale.AAC.3